MKKQFIIGIFLAVFTGIFLAFFGCSSEDSGPFVPSGEAPNIPEGTVTSSADSQGWTRYLAYTRPPSETLILEPCGNTAGFPELIDITLEGAVDNGFRSEYESYYYYPRGYYYEGGGLSGDFFSLNGGAVPTDSEAGGQSGAPPERAVAEPDIYAVADNILYTLNTYRGLQAVRVASLDNPHYVNGVYLTGFPNEIYLAGNLVVSTVAGFKPGYGWGTLAGSSLPEGEPAASLERFLESKVVVADVENPEQMEILAEYPLEGTLIESRIVGDVLYTVTYTSNSLIVTSFSLANTPQVDQIDRETVSFPSTWDWELLAYTHLYVSPDYLFASVPVAGLDYYEQETDIHCFDISDPGGQVSPRGVMNVDGRITDRFKMDLYGDTFRVMSGDWSGNNYLSIFDVSDPDAPELLATKGVGVFEQLYATRFDGNRAYIVTYLRTDPLWILDLSEPENPRIVGELIVPGWSMYIEPLGDRLVALGVDDGEGGRRASVSLFSVEDPTNPRLLDRVTVGSDYSSSYGFADYKAFKVLPDENLILLPWTDREGFWWWYDIRLEDQVTLIDLGQDGLEERGSLKHIGTVERPFLSRDHMFVLSQSALQIASIDDRDAPQSLSLLRLLRSARRIVPVGGFALVEDENEWWEVVSLTHPELKPAARVKIEGTEVNVFGSEDAAYVVRRLDYESGVELHRLAISASGEPAAAGCISYPAGVNFSPGAVLSLPDSSVGVVGTFSQWDYYYPLLVEDIGGFAAQAESDFDWSYREGILLIDTSSTDEVEVEGFIDLTEVISGGLPSYYAPFVSSYLSSIYSMRGERLYFPAAEITWELELSSYPTRITVAFYAGRLDLEDPLAPSLLKVNIPGELAYVSEGEDAMYYLRTTMEETQAEEGWTYYLTHTSLGAGLFASGEFQAGNEIELPSYNGIRFEDPYAVVISGNAYQWYYLYSPEPAGESAPSLSLLRIDNVDTLEVQDTISLPLLEAGYSLGELVNGRAFLSLGPFSNPKRIRESAISQGTWYPEGQNMYAYLDLVFRVEDSRLVFDHIHPSTLWNTAPVTAGSRILVPAGMYGIEVLEPE